RPGGRPPGPDRAGRPDLYHPVVLDHHRLPLGQRPRPGVEHGGVARHGPHGVQPPPSDPVPSRTGEGYRAEGGRVGRLTLTRRPPARHLTLLEPGHMTAGSAPHLLSPRARTPLRAVARPELAGLLVCCGLAVVVFARAWASPTTAPNGGGAGDGALF